MDEPLSAVEARKLSRRVLGEGEVRYSQHALYEMETDPFGGISTTDVERVLMGGVVDEAEYEHGSWRHRVRALGVCVVFAFRSETSLVIVTAWRER